MFSETLGFEIRNNLFEFSSRIRLNASACVFFFGLMHAYDQRIRENKPIVSNTSDYIADDRTRLV